MNEVRLVQRRNASKIGLVFLFVPLYWVLGIEQLIWPAITLFLFFSLRSPQFDNVAKLYALFIAFYLVSGFFIVEPIRYITFARTLLLYVSGFFLYVYVINTITALHQVERIIKYLAVFAFISAFIGFLVEYGGLNITFSAPIKYLLPTFLENTGTGQAYINQHFGASGWFPGLGYYSRLIGFHISATLYAATLIILIPLLLYLSTRATGWKRLFLLATIGLATINLVFTTVRGAIVGLIMGGIAFLYFRYLSNLNIYAKATGVLFGVAIALCILLVSLNLPSELIPADYSQLETYAEFRSTDARLYLWGETIESWSKRPFFGWGTQRDFPGLHVPLGSHSNYLGILYKQGAVGLLLHLMILFSIFKSALKSGTSYPAGTTIRSFIGFALFAFIANSVHQLAEFMALDAITFHIMWLLYGLIVVSRPSGQTGTSAQGLQPSLTRRS